MLKSDEAITKLNSIKATLGVSKIQGIGVVAIRDIFKGEKVYADELPNVFHIPVGSLGKIVPEVKDIILARWPNIIHGAPFISPDARLLSFMNHSDTPNYDPYTDMATKDIKKGEEVTEDYRIVKDYDKVYPWLKVADKI